MAKQARVFNFSLVTVHQSLIPTFWYNWKIEVNNATAYVWAEIGNFYPIDVIWSGGWFPLTQEDV